MQPTAEHCFNLAGLGERGNDLPNEVSLEDKTTVEQVRLIQELDQEEKNMVFKMVETFLTNKKFKDFFNKNIATL